MPLRQTRRSLMDEYERLVTETRAKFTRARDLDRMIDQFRMETSDLSRRVDQLVEWRNRRLVGIAAASPWLH